MKYLILNSRCEVVEKLNTRELKERVGIDNIEAILIMENALSGFSIVEDNIFFDADRCKCFAETERYKYFATDEGDFYSICRRTDKRRKLKIHEVHRRFVVQIGGKRMNAARIIAQLFMKDFSEDRIVRIRDRKRKPDIGNIYLSDRKDIAVSMSTYNRKKVGKFDAEGNCIGVFDSVTEAAKENFYSLRQMQKIVNGEVICRKEEFRYL